MKNQWQVLQNLLLHLGVHASLNCGDRSIPSWIPANNIAQKRKPEVIRSLIERVVPNRYFEIYAWAAPTDSALAVSGVAWREVQVMVAPKQRVPSLAPIIRDEVQRRLNRGLPVPLFLFTVCPEDELPASLQELTRYRNLLALDENHGLLVAVDYNEGLATIAKAAPDIADELHQIPAKPVAVVVILDHECPSIEPVRIDLTGLMGGAALRERIDAKKTDDLCGLLEGYSRMLLSTNQSPESVQREVRTALERVLSYLLQRFPSSLELDTILARIGKP